MSKKSLTSLLVIVLLTMIVFFIFKGTKVKDDSKDLSPTATVETFYETWTNYEGEDILEGTYRENELITAKFVERIDAATGVDPVLCAPDIPKHFEVDLKTKNATTSTVKVKEYFEDSTSSLEAKLVKKNKKWLINRTNCSSRLK